MSDCVALVCIAHDKDCFCHLKKIMSFFVFLGEPAKHLAILLFIHFLEAYLFNIYL